MVLRQIDQLLVHHVAHQPDAAFRIVMVDVTIDAILVDMFGEQLRDDEEDFRAGAVEGEAAGIGHHTAVDRDGEVLRLLLKGPHLPYDAEH